MKIIFKISVLFLIATSFSYAKIVSIETREGIEQLFDLIKPKNGVQPNASVILFTGGDGYLKMDKKKWKKKGNFLVRTRKMFRAHNLAVAVVDAPSDYRYGMPASFRLSDEHIHDIDSVIRYMKNKFKKPVWLIGTSRGTVSVSYLGIYSEERVDGIVLTASISEPNKTADPRPITELPLDKIAVPTLVVSHEKDRCYVSPSYGSKRIYDQLETSKKELKFFTGGKEKSGNPCKGKKSYHGFFKIEQEVVDHIANFIKAN